MMNTRATRTELFGRRSLGALGMVMVSSSMLVLVETVVVVFPIARTAAAAAAFMMARAPSKV